jgi:hypothetical protein
VHILFILQTLFSLAMVVHAIKRGMETYWYLIIMVPFGEWAYFFAVYLPSRKTGIAGQIQERLTTRRTSVRDLELEFQAAPTHRNQRALAEAYYDRREYRQAKPLFKQIVNKAPGDMDARYGYSACLAQTGGVAEAAEQLEAIVDSDPSAFDFRALEDLAEAYGNLERSDDAIALLRDAAQRTSRMAPRVHLAELLLKIDRAGEAQEVLTHALHDHKMAPAYVRKQDGRHARHATKLLAMLSATAPG